MNLPRNPDPFLLKGFSLRQLYEGDKAQMMRMQDEVLSTLADPAWFFPSEEWEFDEWLLNREAFGYFDGDMLAGYAAMASWRTRGDRGYARKLGEPEENTYDFHDVLVLPRYRGRGMHTRFLNLFEEMARSMGGRAIYATVDPGNSASWHNFEKQATRWFAPVPPMTGACAGITNARWMNNPGGPEYGCCTFGKSGC